MLKKNRMRELLSTEKPVLGIHLPVASPTLIEMLGLTGYEFLMLDGEHHGFGVETSYPVLRAAELVDMSVISRAPSAAPDVLAGYADAGADVIIAPHSRTVKDVENILNAVHFPPRGERSLAGSARGAGWGLVQSAGEYLDDIKRHAIACPLLEHIDIMNAVEEVAQVTNLEMVAIGPNDLAASMGHHRDPNHREVSEVINKAVKILREEGIRITTTARDAASARSLVDIGVDIVIVPMGPVLSNAAAAILKDFRASS